MEALEQSPDRLPTSVALLTELCDPVLGKIKAASAALLTAFPILCAFGFEPAGYRPRPVLSTETTGPSQPGRNRNSA